MYAARNILGIFLVLILLNPIAAITQIPAESTDDLQKKTTRIFFDSDKDALDRKAKQTIRNTIIELGSSNIREIYVEGHADSDASDQYNQDLSARRAANTQHYLEKQGVKDEMIRMEYFGESKPKSQLKAENRRVQLTFIYEDPNKDLYANAKIRIISVFDSDTKQRLACKYIYEQNDQNRFGRTNKHGVCLLHMNDSDTELTFIKEGYLNEGFDMSTSFIKFKGDTAYADVYMRRVQVVQKLRFEHIYFYTDSDEFKPESKPELKELLLMLRENKELYIEIQGHMNFPVTRRSTPFHRKYNLDLSHRRAKAVYNYLIDNGIDKSRLTFKGLSNYRMIYPTPQSIAEEDMNKRVEVWTLQLLADIGN